MYEQLAQQIKDHVLSKQRQPIPFPPVNARSVGEAEAALGFRIPELLRAIYLNVGNGGFGPDGNGGRIIGLKGGDAFFLGTLVETYEQVKTGAEWSGDRWKDGLLPFCGWGCNIFTCVDCNDVHSQIYQSEECDAQEMGYTLDDFFKMWLDGVDILSADTSPRQIVEIVNPFTRRKTRVVGGHKKKPK